MQFRIERADGATWDTRRTTLLTETTGHAEWRTAIAWLVRPDEAIDDLMAQAVKSREIVRKHGQSEADRDVAQFVRAERRAAEKGEERVAALFRDALLSGTLIFRGNPTPAGSAGASIEAAARKVLQDAAATIYPSYRLVALRPSTDLAAKLLGVDRLDRMTRDLDPLGFVTTVAGRPRVDAQHPALAEALRAFREKLDHAGTTRLQGNAIQDLFAGAPYGWSKDATRYVFAGLLVAVEVVFHTAAGEVRTAGPTAIEAVRTTQAFNKIGVALRGDNRPTLDQLDRAASRLESMFGVSVLPLEDHVSRAVRDHVPERLERIAPLAAQLRLLELAGVDRAQALADTARALLQSDGAAAIGVLGAVECAVPDDLRWAEAVADTLAQGADADVRAARAAVSAADELTELFPSTALALVAPPDRDTLADALSSDAFCTRLADLRAVVRRVTEFAAATYRERLALYDADLARARAALEQHPDWLDLSDDDRADLAGRLRRDLPDTPAHGAELSALRALLIRQTALPGLLQELERDVERRRPKPTGVKDGDGPESGPIDFELPTTALSSTIGSLEDLDAWLAGLREQIASALAAGAPLRLRVRR
ncbi:MAG: hypothetical protein HY329_15550 [Chloroflexi bacterium]|nr:hypothetical protein [Chloroflexota bacterium]